MSLLNPDTLILFMSATLFIVGLITFIIGVFTLTLRANTNEVKSLAIQTTRLAHKGLTEGVVGLAGHATDLLDALDQLVRTTKGTGIFLSMAGLLMMGFASWLAITLK